MWVSRQFFDMVLREHRDLTEQVRQMSTKFGMVYAEKEGLVEQKAKDDVTIDWMRHRINALEKERAALLQRAAGIALPTPEIATVDTSRSGGIPKDIQALIASTFEDMGDAQASTLKIGHDEGGNVVYDTKE